MNVCVVGLWHLGSVTAACLASGGHQVVGLDFDIETIHNLQDGKAPISEPGLDDMIQSQLKEGQLQFTTDIKTALSEAEIIWVTYDTPVDDEDRADVDFVVQRIERLLPDIMGGALVLISSQLPVGTTSRLEKNYSELYPNKPITFAYSPENLRLGKSISVFTQPDRVVVGTRSDKDRDRVTELLAPFTDRIELMSVESAEMTKHALNSFLAVSVTFANEIATLCEQVDADAKEVERGLKSEARIGPKAYLSPGGAFAGGTLARDISFLSNIGKEYGQETHLLSSVRTSNNVHKQWVQRKLQSMGSLNGKRVAIWGLTYKAGTNTLRRSNSVELCLWLAEQNAVVQAYDPSIDRLPNDLAQKISLSKTALDALSKASILVVSTEWPEFQTITADNIDSHLEKPVIIDVNRFLVKTVGNDPRFSYIVVGGISSKH